MESNKIRWDFPHYTAMSRIQYGRDKGLQEFIKARLNITNESRVLDVGCGIGVVEMLLAPFIRAGQGQIIGIDLDSSLIEFGRGNIRDSVIQLMQGDARELDFPSNSFDIVISMGLLENIAGTDVERVLSEMLRVLKTPGQLVIIQLDVLNYLTSPKEEFFDRFYKDLLEGMQRLGADLGLRRFLELCRGKGIALKKSTYKFEFSSPINEKFISFYIDGLKSMPIADETFQECVEFNYQFVKMLGWSREDLQKVYSNTLSVDFQRQFFERWIGAKYHKSLPIHLYVFNRG